MNLFSSAFRYALALAVGLGLMHFGAGSARAEACGGAAGVFSSPSSFSGATPVATGTIPAKKIASGASSVRFSARFYFTETSGSAMTYSAVSSHPGIARAGDICGSMITIIAFSAGTAKITVTASANGGSATQEVSVAVDPKAVFPSSPSNNAPVAAGTIANRTFTRATSPDRFVVSSYFSDSDGDDLTYAATPLRTSVARASVTDSTLTLTAVSKDSTRVTITATDPDGLVARQSFVATVANSSPVAEGAISGETFTRATSPVRLSVSSKFSDPDPEDNLKYTVSSSRTTVAGVRISGSTLTLTAGAKGTAKITVTARDEAGLSANQSFNVRIANSPPVAKGSISAKSLTLGSSPSDRFGVSSYFTDADPNDTLTYSSESSKSSVATASISGSTLTLRAVSSGSATVTVTALDGAASAVQRFTVEVNEKPNSRPVIKKKIVVEPFTVGDAAVTYNLGAYFSDPDPEDRLTYEAESSSSSVAVASVSESTLRITPKGTGDATITVTATDTGDLSVSQDVEVEVKAKPAPLKVAITGPSRIESGSSHTWRSTVTGGVPSYRYGWYVATRCTTVPDNLQAAAEDEPCRLQWVFAGFGTSIRRTVTTTLAYASIRLVVRDAGSPGSSVEATHSVAVYQPNNPPVANGVVSSRTLTLGSSATRLDVSSWFTDKDNDRLTYTVSSSPSGVVNASIPSNSSALTLSTLKAGTTRVTVTARDPSRASATQSFSVRVNSSPVSSKSIPAQTVTVGGAAATLNLAEYFSDPDGDRLSWLVNRSNGRVTTSVSGNTLTIRPVSAGTTTLTVIAGDTYRASVSQSVTVNIATAAGLSASIVGPSRVSSESGRKTWTARVSGGRSPYAYRWRYRRPCVGDNLEADEAREVCTEWASGGSSSSFRVTLTAGTTIELRVTDANDDSVTTTLGVRYTGL